MIAPVTFIALAVLAYALVSKRLASTVVTAPIFFAAVGLLAGPVLGLVDLAADEELLVLILEAALVMVLFADSSGLDVRRWTKEARLSGRLLGIGLPLTMMAGTVGAALLLGLEPWQAGLVGVILAPTDAALGQAVVANPRVPGRRPQRPQRRERPQRRARAAVRHDPRLRGPGGRRRRDRSCAPSRRSCSPSSVPR